MKSIQDILASAHQSSFTPPPLRPSPLSSSSSLSSSQPSLSQSSSSSSSSRNNNYNNTNDEFEEDCDIYLPFGKIKKGIDVSSMTLIRWAKAGKIRFKTMPGGKRLYHKRDVDNIIKTPSSSVTTVTTGAISTDGKKVHHIIYARALDENRQKEYMEKQIEHLKKVVPHYTHIIKDYGYGTIDGTRPGFAQLYNYIYDDSCKTRIYVTRSDRLCTEGLHMFKEICTRAKDVMCITRPIPNYDEYVHLLEDIRMTLRYVTKKSNELEDNVSKKRKFKYISK